MKFLAVLLVSFVLLCPVSARSQSLTYDSNRKALAILDVAIAAHGGINALRAISSVSFRVVGESVHRNQSRRPGTFDRTPYTADVVVDVAQRRYRQVQRGQYPGGFHWHQGFVIDGATRTSFDLIRNTLNPAQDVQPMVFRQQMRWLPQLLLLDCLERPARMRHLGTADLEKRQHDVLGGTFDDGLAFSLYVDRTTRLISKFETLGVDRVAGDAVTETVFSEYRSDGARQVPARRAIFVNGEPAIEVRFEDLVFNAVPKDTSFAVPEGLRPVTFPAPVPVTKLADRVYLANVGGYNVLFVEFADHVFVMETPSGDRVSRQVIESIAKTVPGKPIRYVAVSHHHDDHAGGIRTYIAEGATLIVAPGERAHFEETSRRPFRIEPDALALNPKAPKFEVVEGGRRVLTDGETTVELLDIGAGPHAEAMLVAYLPKQKMLYQGDLLNRPPNGDVPIANATTIHFAAWLEASKLDVETIVPVHGTLTTMDELRAAVDVARKSGEPATAK